jgi:peptide/nickel transport system substrate-binding protein
MRKKIWALVGVTLFLVSACTSSTPSTSSTPTTASQQPQTPKQVTILQSAEVKSMDPSNAFGTHEINVQGQVFDTLATIDPQLNQLPWLATSWTMQTPTTWQVKLRSGVKFSNGDPFGADDVVASFKYMTRADAQAAPNFQGWASVEKVDDSTVKVTTKAPDIRFFGELTSLYVMPAKVLSASAASLADKPIGSGPYKLTEWVKGERIVMEANPDYWKGKPKIDKVIWKAVPEASSRIAALQAGQADLIVSVPPQSVDLINSAANTRVDAAHSLRNITLIFDSRAKPFNDVRVRQAMNYAIDKDSIIKNILGGRAALQVTTSYDKTPNHNSEVKPYPFDPQKAKDLLAQAGYPSGFTVEFHHPTGRWIKDVEVAQAIAGMLAKVGVQTTLSTGEYTSFFNTWATGAYKGMTMIGTLNQYDADQVYQLFLYSKGRWGAYTGVDTKLDGMYEAQNTELDAKKREQILHDMEAYVRDQAYWLFLYFQDDVYASNKKLNWRAPSNERIWMLDADLS